ncbi:MAG: mannose-1-phosphate guanylyltransferase/mannose-6-phosphate isomerase [Pelagibacterales bacterium]|nr:mannose-1-phosphate guanylyltransferase/mannose-6-phosphate isomerase [Pelagibacterales bacterium]|tara:strand:- start:23750 stop:25177 length:1428 start_codon:yes stop_codon:yes gene_type:complete
MKNTKLITPLILAGGSGTRLWPISRKEKPKQFLEIFDSYSLLQLTALRCQNSIFNKPIFIVGESQRFIIAEQLRKIGIKNANILIESKPKNTLAAITAGVLYSKKIIQDGPLLVLPSDHYINNSKKFITLIKDTIKNNIKNKLICFGIEPTSPETKYGYIIKENSKLKSSDIYKIKSFKEKPKLNKAKILLQNGALWNSGMFLFEIETIIEEVQSFYPKMLSNVDLAIKESTPDLDFIRLNEKYFNKVESISIDNAIFEKTDKSFVKPANINWNDLGTYNALWEISNKDKNNNVVKGDIILNNVNNSYVFSDKTLVTVSNVSDINIVATQDAILVTNIKKSNEIKSLIEKLERKKRNELTEHSITQRPWGYYENISSSENHKVKKLTVLQGKELSLQSHNKRSEHWVVISGTATVTKGNKKFILKKNESTFIPVKTKHRLANKSKSILEIIEVQTGVYFGEDDIKRYEDKYGRIK